MEGVRILAEQAVYTCSDFWTIMYVMCIPLAIVGALITLFCLCEYIDNGGSTLLIVTFVFIVLTIATIGGTVTAKQELDASETLDYIEQKVIVESSVNMNEFFKYYELLEQDGEIYIVKERKWEDKSE